MWPAMLYGTAWKEEDTAPLVLEALRAGFRGIDTANQRKHYHEAAVGEGLRRFREEQPETRIFLQTKFTYARGQDHRLPYDPRESLMVQVRRSFQLSLEHLGVEMLDSLLLHGPELGEGLTEGDWQVWREMEALHAEGRVRHLGISNVSPEQVRQLAEGAKIRPSFVQNRCYARRGMDQAVRRECARGGMIYQGFSLLTANRSFWNDKRVFAIARRLSGTPAQVIFAYARSLGILPITGTTDPAHMRADLEALKIQLTDPELESLQAAVRETAS